MRGKSVLLLCVSLSGCARYVVHVETDPGGAKVTLNGNTARGDRWSVPHESGAEIVTTWPDGRRLATALLVDRDMRVVVRRDGDPSQVVGARPMLAAPAATPGPAPMTPVPAPAPAPAAEEAGDPMTRAKGLAEAGQKAYELTDYEEAITRFKQAYELIRSSKDPRAPEILGNILYNLAVVYERSHEVTPEVERLRRARVMYRQFDEQMAALVKDWAASAEHADVLSRIRALDARIGDK
ncbi:MAG TPA: tetratricopeptide repeat protein [Nannocystis sp.]|jgi:tetratricopeptide (TPR) repeat protein